MFERKNSITGVQKACERLQTAFAKKYPTSSDSRFEIGIDPDNGKYAIVTFLSDPSLNKRLPPTVDGYKVFNGFEPFDFEKGASDA